METITSITQWLFLDSIYGVLIIAAAVYFFSTGLRIIVPKFPNPSAIAGFAFIVALFTLPSISRYQFEKKSLSKIEEREWIKVIKKTNGGSIYEPLTWFYAPVDSILTVMPNSPIEGGFREVIMRYEEEPHVTMSDPDCTARTILFSEPYQEGVFRYTSVRAKTMSEQEVSTYCKYDWAKEKGALRAEILRKMNPK